ncbi:MAG TPA: DALR anticodon-binding domain-containing protein [Streptosporangiaceae bacterium]|nr:DALR anticodon-binding domain-containing protein [Streptosporangiaceae bacterium]
MTIGDLSAAVAAAAGAAQAAGVLAGPVPPDGAALAGTWRPVPAADGGGPGSYATSIPFVLASRSGSGPAEVAAVLAAQLPGVAPDAGIARAAVTGAGYLSLTVSPDALGQLAARIIQAGPDCARSDALRGAKLAAPRQTSLADAEGWDDAWRWLAAELTGRLASAAGAEVTWVDRPARPGPAGLGRARPGLVAGAVEFAGPDAIQYALCRAVPRGTGPTAGIRGIDPGAAAAQHLGNPFYAVRYAHVHAASIRRQSADPRLPAADPAQLQPRLLAHPRERALLDAMSWLPERVAGAARRRQPHVLAAYLEGLAGTYLDWQQCCSLSQPGAVPPGPAPWPGTPLGQARLLLASAVRTVLGTGLGLLGVAAPDSS